MDIEQRIRGIVANEVARILRHASDDNGDVGSADSEDDAREVMSAEETARFLGVQTNTVYEYANQGLLPHRRLGKRRLFSRTALVAWLAHETASS